MTITKVNTSEARSKWRDLLDQVYLGSGDIIIERSGKPVAVLIPADDYEMIRDTLDDLRSENQAAIAYAEWQRDSSVARPWQDVKADLKDKGKLDA